MTVETEAASRLVAAGIFALTALVASSAIAADGSTHGPTAPGGEWVEPEYREAGDVMVFGGPAADVGRIGNEGLDDEVWILPGLDFGANLHLGNNVAFTGRIGGSWDGENVSLPVLGGVRLQFPFGESTVAFGPEIGFGWSIPVEDDQAETTSQPVGAFRTSYEYTFEDGWTLGVDASLNTFVGVGTFPRAGLKLGYEFGRY